MNGARDPVKVVIHKGGWSSVDKRGPFFYDGEAGSVFVTALKRQSRQDIDVREGDAGLEIPEFARAALDAFVAFHA
jgi:uncharacterized protein (UPF0261 family)